MAFDDEQKKCGGITLGGVFAIGVSIAMIAVGLHNIDLDNSKLDDPNSVKSTCRPEPKIPYYLVVAGVLTIILIVTRLILQCFCRKCGECGDDNKCCNTINHICKFSCITLYDLIALALTIVWLVVGTSWVMSVYDEVSYQTSSSNYCPKHLYIFSVVCIVLGWISVALAILCGLLCKFCDCFFSFLCCKPCKEADANATV